MASSFVNQLVNLIVGPYALIGIAIGLLILYQAKRSRRLAWLLFSACCYASSLAKYQDFWIKEPPPLVFPLQQLRDTGRPITIVLLALLLLLGMQTRNGWRRILIPQPIYYLMAVQAAIFLKTLLYGNMEFAFLAALTFGSVVLMIRLGPARWLQDEYNFQLGVWSLAMVGVIFAFANAYQSLVNIHAVTFAQGRFIGTTANSQHAAALLAGTVPCFMFLIENRKKWDLIKVFWIGSLVLIGYFLFLTGSRTGAIMGITSILFFYRQRAGSLVRLVLLIGILLAILLPLLNQDFANINLPVANRFILTENTRQQVWSGQWNGFINNPLFGSPLEADRLGFGENVWLAAAASTGLLGFIPLVIMGLGSLKMMLALHQLSLQKPIYFMQSSTIVSGLACLLSGSFTEALFLGNLTFPVMSLLIYLSLGKYLLDVNDMQNKYMLWLTTQK
jgi:O-Antigen ligase